MKHKKFNLETILNDSLDCLIAGKKAKVKNATVEYVAEIIPDLIAHHVEGIVFSSMPGFENMEDFFDNTYKRQKLNVITKLESALINNNAVFIQGFSRYEMYSKYYTQGIRGDIDIFIPKENIKSFNEEAKLNGFLKYGFDEQKIFLPHDELVSKVESTYWVNKEFTLKWVEDSVLPKDFPIDINGSYFPYLFRDGRWKMMTTIEVHHYYINELDSSYINSNRIAWDNGGFERLNITATIFFSLIRLYHGVLHSEKRMRIIIDIACALVHSEECINYNLLAEMMDNYPREERGNILSVCAGLGKIHSIFFPLEKITSRYKEMEKSDVWLKMFMKTLESQIWII
ncbi:hypothetical protein AB204_20630 [Xenorhabdus khoisanae]|uniref:Nucleotidyltransferase n=1 Tax=Xenorhabdus khoisanae TaxID=880157 RepID=A0A0J5FME9_9GAMM|nr:hypothetical protein [Xenorhabdus khoisanae]KMJ43274.1 hypothetical protein AB204_20630 [Xenorhabdus khoisanae]